MDDLVHDRKCNETLSTKYTSKYELLTGLQFVYFKFMFTSGWLLIDPFTASVNHITSPWSMSVKNFSIASQ